MFVFWYCHKRGKEVRLAREAEAGHIEEGEEDAEVTDSADGSDVEQMVEELEKVDEQQKEEEGAQGADEKAKEDVLNQDAPSDVPLPEKEAETKGEEGEKKEEGAATATT